MTGPAPARGPGLLARGFLLFVLVLLSGALQRPLGGDTLQGSMSGVIVQAENRAILLLGLVTFALAGLALVVNLPALRLPGAVRALVALNLLALASALWSPLPELTLKRALGLSGATLCALWALSLFRARDIAAALVWMATLIVALTALLALAAPGYAFHGTAEFFAEHAGRLKGSYVHKNGLGRVLALCIIILVVFGGPVLGRWRMLGLVVLAIWLMALTGSAKTFVAVPAALGLGWLVTRPATPAARLALILAGLWAGLVVAVTGLDARLVEVLLAAVDRDPTFSGRTQIWEAALRASRANSAILGGGYEAAWPSGIGPFVQSWIGYNPGHPHNGFLHAYLDLGLAGLGLVVAHVGVMLRGVVTATAPEGRRAATFLAAWTALLLINNGAGSYLILPADLYWFLMLLAPLLPCRPGEAAAPGPRAPPQARSSLSALTADRAAAGQ